MVEDGEVEEKNCWIKLLFLLALRTKSILIASYNYSWTTDVAWTILTMSLLRFCGSYVAVYAESESSRILSKIS